MKVDVKEIMERHYKRRYEDALAFAEYEGPAWEDLTEQQRTNIRAETDRYAKEMQEFGAALAALKPDTGE